MQRIAVFLVFFGLILFVAWRAYTSSHAMMTQEPLIIETVRGPVHFTVEVATTRAQQEQGLMYRKSLPHNAGMLFDLHREKRVTLWMKNTLIRLDIVFIKENGIITLIVANAKPMSLDFVESREPVRAVLEIPGGRAAQLGLRPGDHAVNAIFNNVSQ